VKPDGQGAHTVLAVAEQLVTKYEPMEQLEHIRAGAVSPVQYELVVQVAKLLISGAKNWPACGSALQFEEPAMEYVDSGHGRHTPFWFTKELRGQRAQTKDVLMEYPRRLHLQVLM
jgi:hypothetical protein